jgi:ribulose 1,5-bisphosphate carboxylase large subunit-like protein
MINIFCLIADFLKENNSVINNKYQELAKWNERIKKYHKHNQEKCEEAKTLILNLRSENDDLKKQLQETKTQAFHTLVSLIGGCV